MTPRPARVQDPANPRAREAVRLPGPHPEPTPVPRRRRGRDRRADGGQPVRRHLPAGRVRRRARRQRGRGALPARRLRRPVHRRAARRRPRLPGQPSGPASWCPRGRCSGSTAASGCTPALAPLSADVERRHVRCRPRRRPAGAQPQPLRRHGGGRGGPPRLQRTGRLDQPCRRAEPRRAPRGAGPAGRQHAAHRAGRPGRGARRLRGHRLHPADDRRLASPTPRCPRR